MVCPRPWSSPPAALVDRLRCPRCGQPVAAADAGGTVDAPREPLRLAEGLSRRLGPAGGRRHHQHTYASFGYEWNTFDEVRDEDVGFADVYFRDVDFATLRGKVGMDAGCGKGRYTRFVAPHLDNLVALDGSSAVEAAVRNLAEFQRHVVKSDLRTAPFALESFDFIFCLGVLHHLDDPQAGFRQLVRFLAPGGSILLYLYGQSEDRHPQARPVGLGRPP